MEDKRLHEAPKGWISDSKSRPFTGIGIAILTPMVGAFMSLAFDSWYIFIMSIGAAVLIAAMSSKKLYDNKDDWFRHFSCSVLLHHTLLEHIEDYLSTTGARFTKKKNTKALVSCIRYRLRTYPYFTITIEREAGSIALTRVVINNIKLDAVKDAKVLVDVVNHIIREARKDVVNTAG